MKGRWRGRGAWCLVFALWFPFAPALLADDRAQPEGESGFAHRPAVRAPHGMVVTANPHATRHALAALQEGGSAFDAAMVAVLVLNVVEPQSSGIGGGAFLLHYTAEDGGIVAWDGRETAPSATDERLFLDEQGRPLPFFDAVLSGRAIGVPGLLRMLEAAHAEHGQLPWARLLEPAIALAEEGFEVSPRLHTLLTRDRFLRQDPTARQVFYDADGRALPVGARLRIPELADTLRRVAAQGSDVLHEGELAADIVAAVRRAPGPGLLSAADLRNYRVERRAALCRPYREKATVCGMPLPSAGSLTVLSMLGMLERFELSELDPASAFTTHLFAEAGRLAQADREAWYGAEEEMRVPLSALLDADYLHARGEQIPLSHSLGQAQPGRPLGMTALSVKPARLRVSTTHVSVVDAQGNAAALTASVENVFGSRRMVRGFLLNNQLTDFSFEAQTEDGRPHPNRVVPGRRPLSSMAPTLVFDAHGELLAVTGSPGGSRIAQYVAASLIGLLDWRLAPDVLLARAHAGSRNGRTEVERSAGGEELARRLRAFGHEPVLTNMTSGLAVIVREGDAWVGAADPRREGLAAGFSR